MRICGNAYGSKSSGLETDRAGFELQNGLGSNELMGSNEFEFDF